jgi:hypothetical protein
MAGSRWAPAMPKGVVLRSRCIRRTPQFADTEIRACGPPPAPGSCQPPSPARRTCQAPALGARLSIARRFRNPTRREGGLASPSPVQPEGFTPSPGHTSTEIHTQIEALDGSPIGVNPCGWTPWVRTKRHAGPVGVQTRRVGGSQAPSASAWRCKRLR